MISKDNVDWVELKNISTGIVDLKDWELSIVTGKGVDNDLVKPPEYELGPGEILLLLNKDPWFTSIAGGANIDDPDQQEKESARKFLVDTRLHLPNTGKFVLLLRNKSDQNKKAKRFRITLATVSSRISLMKKSARGSGPVSGSSCLLTLQLSERILLLRGIPLGHASAIKQTMDITRMPGRVSKQKADKVDSVTTRCAILDFTRHAGI